MIQQWHKRGDVSFVFITVPQVNDKNKRDYEILFYFILFYHHHPLYFGHYTVMGHYNIDTFFSMKTKRLCKNWKKRNLCMGEKGLHTSFMSTKIQIQK